MAVRKKGGRFVDLLVQERQSELSTTLGTWPSVRLLFILVFRPRKKRPPRPSRVAPGLLSPLRRRWGGICRTCRTCEGWGSRNRMLGPKDISGSGDSTDLGLLKTNTPSSSWRWGPALMTTVNSTRIVTHTRDTPPRTCLRFAIRNSHARSVDDITPLYSWP